MAKPKPSRYAAALQYLQQMRDRAADFGGGVVENLADRARSVGGLAYEAFTSDPNIGRMTTAEYAQAADRPTPRLDQAAQDLGTIGKAIVTQPVQTGKALVQGEVERAQQAMTSPRAAGEYAGSMVDPMRIAAALRKTAPIAELDVYHGTPHRFPETEANPLGEFDASRIGTGEGAQAYGHGIYFAENPSVASSYRSPKHFPYEELIKKENKEYRDAQANLIKLDRVIRKIYPDKIPKNTVSAVEFVRINKKNFPSEIIEKINQAEFAEQSAYQTLSRGPLYKADLPDDMIDRMLDYDKPLSEQPTSVRQALKSAGLTQYVDEMEASYLGSLSPQAKALALKMINGTDEMVIDHGKGFKGNKIAAQNWSQLERLAPGVDHNQIHNIRDWYASKNGADLYAEMVRGGGEGSAIAASDRLRQMGIPGIRYLDAGSRGKGGTGTRNFVVFPGEEKKVKILKRD